MEYDEIDYLTHLFEDDAEALRSIHKYITQAALKILIENGIFPTAQFVAKYSEVGAE
jgi:hypothetical protein